MPTIMDFLAQILNPNQGQPANQLVGPSSLDTPNYLAQPGLGPEQLARYHQASGLGAMPQGAPQAASMPSASPMPPDQQQTASVTPAGPSGGGIGGFLGGLFGGGGSQRDKNMTAEWLVQQGENPARAQLIASDPRTLQQYLLQRTQGQKPIEVNGRLVDPNTYEVIADFSDKTTPNRPTAVVDGKVIDTNTGQVIGDYGDPKDPSLVNAGDGNLYDPQSEQWITAPNAGQKPPQVVELFDETTGQPYKATWNAEKSEYERVGGVKARSGMQLTTNPDGTVTLTEGSIGGMPKLTEAEGRNAGFYGRSVESHALLSDLEKEGTSLWNKAAGGIPVVGNYALGPDAQKFQQAQRDFINAVLRRESGAVISPEEFENAKLQYFPQPGDGPEVIEQKRKNRETTILGLKISGGQGSQFAIPGAATAAPGQPDTERFGGKQDRVGAPKRFKFNPATGELE